MKMPLKGSAEEITGLDRRTVLAGLAAWAATSVAMPGTASAASKNMWTTATQIIAGARVNDATFLQLAIDAIESEFGAATVEQLLDAVLARDAANIVEPFPDANVEAAARRFVEIVYTGETSADSAVGFHQALAWQVLKFTKPPSVCGNGFGWWTNRPDER